MHAVYVIALSYGSVVLIRFHLMNHNRPYCGSFSTFCSVVYSSLLLLIRRMHLFAYPSSSFYVCRVQSPHRRWKDFSVSSSLISSSFFSVYRLHLLNLRHLILETSNVISTYLCAFSSISYPGSPHRHRTLNQTFAYAFSSSPSSLISALPSIH